MARPLFEDRADAGRQLAAVLVQTPRAPKPTVVLGLPRGGVPVAAVVAAALDAPLDVVAVRKLGGPRHPELALGAIGEGGARVVDTDLQRRTGVSDTELAAVEAAEIAELDRRLAVYRSGRPRLALDGARAVVVDDGVATGATAEVACRVIRQLGAEEIVLAVPVAPADWTLRLAGAADEFVAVAAPRDFWAVGQWYARFDQTSDAEVIALLGGADSRLSMP
ncbi:putative phosphoribosyltransferase [Conyzicola lurida]|uniref:Putative phosphoribosyltransferase n=1 Tax=Conyzicola lurida TaxID=1172621 RepID=A0A841AN32_9MICO|nr:putative phosphoribosyltransferase [Conyzicola lurida]